MIESMILLYVIGALLLAVLSGLVFVGIVVWEDNVERGLWRMSKEWIRGYERRR